MRRFEVTRFAGIRDTAGKRMSVTWPLLAAMLTDAGHAPWKLAAPVWSPATFTGTRAAKNVVEVSALVLDFDDGLPIADIADAERAASGLAAAWHTSWSHTTTHARFRLVVNLSRSMTPDEHARVWSWAFQQFSSGGRTPDAACKDAGRAWLLPVRRAAGTFAAKILAGAALDVDHVLSLAPPAARGASGGGQAGQAVRPPARRPLALPPQVEAVLRSSLSVKRLWEGHKTTGDASRSGCDYAVARELLGRGVAVEVVVAALAFRPGVHSQSEDYLVRTVSKALRAGRRSS